MSNIEHMLRQAQMLTTVINQKRAEVNQRKFEGSSGNGAVTVVFTGERNLLSVHIDPSLKDQPQQLEAHLCAAINTTLARIQECFEKEFRDATGGMIPPGLFN